LARNIQLILRRYLWHSISETIKPRSINVVNVYGKQKEKDSYVWTEELVINPIESPIASNNGGQKEDSSHLTTESNIFQFQPHQETFQEILSEYIGQEIGINNLSPSYYEQATLLKCKAEFFSIFSPSKELIYHIPYSIILRVVNSSKGSVRSGGFLFGRNFSVLVQINHLIVNGNGIELSFDF